MTRNDEFGIADSAAQAQHARISAGRSEAQNSRSQVFSQSAHGRLGEVGLRKAGVKPVVVFDLTDKGVRWQA